MSDLIPYNKQKTYLRLEILRLIKNNSNSAKERFLAKYFILKIFKMLTNEKTKRTPD